MSSLDILRKNYRDYAEAHGAATERGDYVKANKSHDKLNAVLRKIKAAGREGELLLTALIQDRNDSVVCWSATHSLPFAEPEAIAALKSLAKKRGVTGFNATMVIQEWANGRLVIDNVATK